MLNSFLGSGQALPEPTNVHLTSDPDPPNTVSSGLATAFYASFDSDPVNSTYCTLFDHGVELHSQLYAPGSSNVLLLDPIFSAPASLTLRVIRVNSSSVNGWPRSNPVMAPETIIVGP